MTAQSGVYEILNTANGKRYIGSAVNFAKRVTRHRCELNAKQHHNAPLQSAWEKYGEEKFKFRLLLICAPRDAVLFEQRAIDVIAPEYNIAKVVAAPMLGRSHTQKTKMAQSVAKLGKIVSAETRAKIGAASRSRSADSNAKIATAATGRFVSAETRAKISMAGKGKLRGPQSAEHIAKLSASRRGKRTTSSTGSEARAKISAAKSAYWARRKAGMYDT